MSGWITVPLLHDSDVNRIWILSLLAIYGVCVATVDPKLAFFVSKVTGPAKPSTRG